MSDVGLGRVRGALGAGSLERWRHAGWCIGGEVEQGDRALHAAIDDDFLAGLLEDAFHHFDVEALSGDFWGLSVGFVFGEEGGDFPFGFGEGAGGVAFGFADESVALGFGGWDELVPFAPGFVDRLVADLDGGVDFIEGRFDAIGRGDALHLEVGDGDTASELFESGGEFLESELGDFFAFAGEEFFGRVIADGSMHDAA